MKVRKELREGDGDDGRGRGGGQQVGSQRQYEVDLAEAMIKTWGEKLTQLVVLDEGRFRG